MTRIRLSSPEVVVFSTEMEVRITDLNYGNHLGHMELVGLLHEARVRFLRSVGLAELDVEGLLLMVVDLAVSYRAEAHASQVLVVDIGLAFTGSRGVDFTYAVRERASGTTIALAKTGVIFADRESRRPVRVPASIRRLVGSGAADDQPA